MAKQIALSRAWDDTQALQAADAVEGLIAHPGWPHFLSAVEATERSELKRLLEEQKPTDNGAEYADRIGQLKGLRRVHEIADVILKHGRAVEEADRQKETENG